MNPPLAIPDPAADAAPRFRQDGTDREPPGVARWFRPVLAILGAALVGFGVILWLAANWDDLGRMGRFVLLQGVVGVACLGAALRPGWRAPLGLAAFLGIGALFAYFGQTYQTGADPWQLFALWAALALPLCFALRSDVLWTPWALVTSVAISLWAHAHIGHRWHVDPDDFRVHALAWFASGLLVAALGPPFRAATGAGAWALRTAGALGIAMVTLTALGALFRSDVASHYPLALVLLAAAAGALSLSGFFDIFLLSATALALDTLLVAGLGRWLFAGAHGDTIGNLLFLGLAAAGLVAASVSGILRAARRPHGMAEVAHG